jgi:DNA-binding CsgD family transcriptional regulator
MNHEIMKRFSRCILGARNADEVFRCVVTSGREAGFDHTLFIAMPQPGSRTPGSRTGPINPFVARSSHPAHLHDMDRFARLLANSSLAREASDKLCPIRWLTPTLGTSGDRNDIETQAALKTASVHHGVSVPVFGFAEEFSLLNFFSVSPEPHECGASPPRLAMFQQIAAQFHFYAVRYLKPAPPGRSLLSIPEIRCLRQIAAGFDLGEIAKHLGISRHTVKYHCRKAALRLGARNRSHAVAIAAVLGLIGPIPMPHPDIAVTPDSAPPR